MSLKKVVGHWDYELFLECPYCETCIMGDDLEGDGLAPGEQFKGRLKCPECGKTFIADVWGC